MRKRLRWKKSSPPRLRRGGWVGEGWGGRVRQGACASARAAPHAPVVRDHVQLVAGLKGKAQRHHKGVVNAAHDAALCARVLHLPPPHHLALLEHLHGVHAARGQQAHQEDLAKAALAQHAQQLKVVHVHGALHDARHKVCLRALRGGQRGAEGGGARARGEGAAAAAAGGSCGGRARPRAHPAAAAAPPRAPDVRVNVQELVELHGAGLQHEQLAQVLLKHAPPLLHGGHGKGGEPALGRELEDLELLVALLELLVERVELREAALHRPHQARVRAQLNEEGSVPAGQRRAGERAGGGRWGERGGVV